MTAIGKGDWVECVDASVRPGFTNYDPLVAGRLYLVEWVGVVPRGFSNPGKPVIRVVGRRSAINPHGNQTVGWNPDRFRPIHPGGALTRLLMEPVSDRIEPCVSRKSRQDQPAHDEPVSSLREVA